MALPAAAILVGGQPRPEEWQRSGGKPYWRGGAEARAGYVPVKMYEPVVGQRGRMARGIGEYTGMDSDTWIDGRQNNAGAVVGPPLMEHRFIRNRGKDDEDDWLLDETDGPGVEKTRSGWGWLADEVLKGKSDADAWNREQGRTTDGFTTEPRGSVGQGQRNDPYAELHDVFSR